MGEPWQRRYYYLSVNVHWLWKTLVGQAVQAGHARSYNEFVARALQWEPAA
jgi:hypothetical protein